jgi:hypothetical protein
VFDAEVVAEREALALGILNEGPAVGMAVGSVGAPVVGTAATAFAATEDTPHVCTSASN